MSEAKASPAMRFATTAWWAVVTGCVAALAIEPARGDDAAVDFGRDVLPILAGHCYRCHGADAGIRKSDLRLDTAAGVAAVVVAGDPAASEIIRRVESDEADEVMPPPDGQQPLTAAQRATLARWVRQGAAWGRHWAFEPPHRPEPPAVQRPTWVRNPIDRFVLARLEAEGLTPAAEAPPETLARRLFLDLTGLPPAPQEVDAFTASGGPTAWESLVDRLLTDDRHAERLAQQWLDLARYADTTGYAQDDPWTMWPWRDWVLEAFRSNMPYDRFVIEQLAGDLLDEPTQAQRIATGFHANAMLALGNTYDFEEYRVETVSDRVATTGAALLGLTIGCARCHDHVFDPITQRDYFRLFAIFNNIPHEGRAFGVHGPRLDIGVRDPRLAARRQELLAAIGRHESEPEVVAREEVLLGGPDSLPTWKRIGRLGWDGDPPPGRDGPSLSLDGTTAVEAPDATAVALSGRFRIACSIRTTDPVADIVSKYDWQADQRAFVFGIGGEGDRYGKPGHLYAWVSATATRFQGVEIHSSIMVADGRWHDVAVEFEPGRTIRLIVDGNVDDAATVVGSPPPAIAASPRPLVLGAGALNGKPDFHYTGLLHGLSVSGETTRADDARSRELQALRSQLADIDRQRTFAQVMQELPTPRRTQIHRRGDFRAPGDDVEPGVLEVLGELPAGLPPNRLGLVKWLVSDRHPLTARVAANRLWALVMGRGLVRSPGDFGTRGQPPTHPELLDWLATELVASGWDQRHLIRLMVTSATYRQSSDAPPALVARDPDNRLLGRAIRRRLDAEQIRDAALAAAGLLDRRFGGPSVYPEMPARLFDDASQSQWNNHWRTSPPADRHRRSLYVTWKRMLLHPTLATLDAPSRESCVVDRVVTNTPLQALVLLNDPVFVEAARAFGARVLGEQRTTADRIDALVWIALSRPATVRERSVLTALVDDGRRHFAADGEAARRLLGMDPPAGVAAAEWAAWTIAASTVLNLDEAISRQ